MKDLKDYIRESTQQEHDDFIEIMKEGLHNDNPKVGIFWYNPSRNELFGVVALSLYDKDVVDCPKGKTCRILHKTKWKKEYNKLKFKKDNQNTFPYIGAYENKPRGRVFFKDNKFYITVGHWIHDDENYRVIDLVEKEFDIDREDSEVIVDHHWDIGSGWENL